MYKLDFSKKHPYYFGIASILVIIIIALQNSEIVTVRFLFWGIEMSRILLIFLVFVIGFLSGYLLRGTHKKSSSKK